MTCDTVHSFFLYQSDEITCSAFNWLLYQHHIIFIDEFSQIFVSIRHHFINTIERIDRRPVLILFGDFTQQQPIATIDRSTKQVPNISSCSHCRFFMKKFTMKGQHRVEDNSLLNLLHHARYQAPTQDMLDTVCAERTLSDTREFHHTICNTLKMHHKFAATHLSSKTQLIHIDMKNEQLVPQHME